MKQTVLLAAGLFALLALCGASEVPVSAQSKPKKASMTSKVYVPFTTGSSSEAQEVAQRVSALVNEHRAQNGCGPVTLHDKLIPASLSHSKDMALNDFFSHTGSDGSSPWDRIADTGYKYSNAAENIAAGYPTPEEVVRAWMDSDKHRANILNCQLQHMGVGYYHLAGDTGTVVQHHYWTQVLAAP